MDSSECEMHQHISHLTRSELIAESNTPMGGCWQQSVVKVWNFVYF